MQAGVAVGLLGASSGMYECLVNYTGARPAEFYSAAKRPEFRAYQARTDRSILRPVGLGAVGRALRRPAADACCTMMWHSACACCTLHVQHVKNMLRAACSFSHVDPVSCQLSLARPLPTVSCQRPLPVVSCQLSHASCRLPGARAHLLPERLCGLVFKGHLRRG